MEVVDPPVPGRPMAKPRRVNWDQLAREAGIVTKRSSEGGTMTLTGSKWACRALEILLGRDNIRTAVRLVLSPHGRREGARAIAESVLRHVHSLQATELAYEAYRRGRQPNAAVMLIGDIAHARALEWVEEFLNDPRVTGAGIRLLDQLLWRGHVDPDHPEARRLLTMAEHHPDEQIRAQAVSIRQSVAARRSPDEESPS